MVTERKRKSTSSVVGGGQSHAVTAVVDHVAEQILEEVRDVAAVRDAVPVDASLEPGNSGRHRLPIVSGDLTQGHRLRLGPIVTLSCASNSRPSISSGMGTTEGVDVFAVEFGAEQVEVALGHGQAGRRTRGLRTPQVGRCDATDPDPARTSSAVRFTCSNAVVTFLPELWPRSRSD